jgi:DNA replication protein DnaC
MSEEHVKEAIKSARQSQKQTASDVTAYAADAKVGSVTSRLECSEDEVRKWKEDIKARRSEDRRRLLNALQYYLAERVADQVCVELRARTTNKYDDFQALRWSLHGGPGTGKSHIIKIIKTELFDKLLHYKIGEDFHIVALQAVMADLLGGDTIHHALNLPAFGRTTATQSVDLRKQQEVAKQLLQLRWLIIDEINMVSARLLAGIYCKLRALARASSLFTNKNTACIAHSAV